MNLWLKEILESMDKHLDETKKAEILEDCGETCPFTHLNDANLALIVSQAESDQDFIDRLSQQWHVKREEDRVYVVFDQCYCPMVNTDISGISQSMCYCTRGNIKRKFRLGLGRAVDVCMEKSILAGDNECRFRVFV